MNKVLRGDCIEQLKTLEDNSVDSIVTDPPYELGFMSKEWDSTGIAYNIDLWKECLRVLKPGGHLLSFGGTRTYHRMVCAIEDAGFEIRDQIQWIYGSGFPKSYNISKGIDKKFGAERKVIGYSDRNDIVLPNGEGGYHGSLHDEYKKYGRESVKLAITIPSTEQAKQWDGWGTALKPAHEPIVLARKPLSEKTIVDNVLKWGTGGLNIDESRIDLNGDYKSKPNGRPSLTGLGDNYDPQKANQPDTVGRFPANVILDEEAGKLLDEQSGHLKSGKNAVRRKEGFFVEHGGLGKAGDVQITYGDSGGASRFFYCAKASKKERGEENTHPTVKPLKLMEYLVNLITPKGGIVLDPFAGSGSTLIAARNKGFDYIGIEKEEEYIHIIEKRLNV